MWSVAAPRRFQGKADPAPSRLAYRYERMMLGRVTRRLIRVGLPSLVVAIALGSWLARDSNRAWVAGTWDGLVNEVQSHPQFMLSAMAVAGADADVERQIRTAVPLDFPVSAFDLSLEGIRETVAGLAPVESAAVQRMSDGVLQLTIVQRQPVLLWRGPEGLRLVDKDGVLIGAPKSRAERAELPLIAGEGAVAAVDEALRLFQAAAPVAPRIRGLQRVGERRWDLVLDRGQVLMLPADQPEQALERVIALSQASDLLERDLAAVDLRVPHRPTIRMSESATEALKEARLEQAKVTE